MSTRLLIAMNRSMVLLIFCGLFACKSRVKQTSDVSAERSKQPSQIVLEMDNNRALTKKIEMIESAKSSIDLAYYVFKDDVVGKTIALKLAERANNGVKVRLIVDGSPHSISRPFFKSLVAQNPENIQVLYFRPAGVSQFTSRFPKSYQALLQMAQKMSDPDGDGASNITFMNVLNSVSYSGAKFLGAAFAQIFNPQTIKDISTAATEYSVDSLMKVAIDTLGTVENISLGAAERSETAHFLFSRSKRLHHKLIITDHLKMTTGGRNMWAPSHLLADQGAANNQKDFNPTTDTDIFMENADIAASAKATFDSYFECATSTSCEAGVDTELETFAPIDKNYWTTHVIGADRILARAISSTRTITPISDKTIVSDASYSDLTYIENTMFKDRSKTGFLAEKPNQIRNTVVELLKHTQKGQKVFIKSAYLIMPPSLFEPLLDAIERGVEVTLLTNSPISSNHAVVPFFGRMQYKALLVRSKELNGSLKILEYNHSNLIHDKVWIIGDSLLVGSSNADPRSFFLNTENDVLIQPSENAKGHDSLAKQYFDWQISQIEELKKRTIFYKRLGKNFPIITEVTIANLLKEEFEPRFYRFVARPKHDVLMTLKSYFDKSIYPGPERKRYQSFLYDYLLLQL